MTTPQLFIWALSSSSSIEKHTPFLKACRELNIKSVLVSHESNDELLCADENYVVPLHDWQALKQIAHQSKPTLVMTQNCRLTPFLATLAKELGINLYSKEAAEILAYKDRWHRFLEQMNLPSPKTILPTQESDFSSQLWGRTPVVLKPSFSTGAVNTFVFENIDELYSSLIQGTLLNENSGQPLQLANLLKQNQDYDEQGGFIVQEYLIHQWQLGIEIFIHQGQVKLIHSAEILVNESGCEAYAHLGPVPIPRQLEKIFQDIADRIGLYNCHLSPDILIDKDGKPYILDVNLNVGAEGLMQAIQSRGLDYCKESLKTLLGFSANWTCEEVATVSYSLPSFKKNPQFQIAREDNANFPNFAKNRLLEWRGRLDRD